MTLHPVSERGVEVDVRIGVTQVPKEIHVELADDVDREKLIAEIETRVAAGDGVLWLTDRKGRRVGIPTAKLAYVEVGSPDETHRVGFGVR